MRSRGPGTRMRRTSNAVRKREKMRNAHISEMRSNAVYQLYCQGLKAICTLGAPNLRTGILDYVTEIKSVHRRLGTSLLDWPEGHSRTQSPSYARSTERDEGLWPNPYQTGI